MESKTGSILALIGGIFELIGAATVFLFALLVLFATKGAAVEVGIGIFYLVLTIVWLIVGILMIKGYKQMKTAETCRSGAIKALVAGIIGLNILAIIGGAIGLSDSKK